MKDIDALQRELDGLVQKIQGGAIGTRQELLRELTSTSDDLRREMNHFFIKYNAGEYASHEEILQGLNGIKEKIARKERQPIFTVNELITLKLEGKHTIIYVNGERFDQCKRIVIDIPLADSSRYDDVDSIDEVAELHATIFEGQGQEESAVNYSITPETEFWGHCSNLQAWVENAYDTRLLHSNLAFPLLKKLVDLGDEIAMRVFKNEIARRLTSGHQPTIDYLLYKGYIEYLQLGDIDHILSALSGLNKDVEFIIELVQHGYMNKIHADYFKINQDNIYDLFTSSEKMEEYNEYHGGIVQWFKHFQGLMKKIGNPPHEKILENLLKKFLNKHAILLFVRLVETCGIIPRENDVQKAYAFLVSGEVQAPLGEHAKKLQEFTKISPNTRTLVKIYEPDAVWKPARGYFTNRLYNFFDHQYNKLRFTKVKQLLEKNSEDGKPNESLVESLVESLFFGWDPLMSYSSNFLDTVDDEGDIRFLQKYSRDIVSHLEASRRIKELEYFHKKFEIFKEREPSRSFQEFGK